MRPDPLACALFIVGALSIAGFMHSAWLRAPVSRRLMMPLDGGRSLRGRRIFGENKTVRGFVVMVPGAALAFWALSRIVLFAGMPPDALWPLSAAGFAALGAWAGLGFMLGELPNSFVKRQLGVAAGEAPRSGSMRLLSFVVDRVDSIIGMLAAVSLAAPTPWMTWVWVLVIGPIVHLGFSTLLFRLGVKARAT